MRTRPLGVTFLALLFSAGGVFMAVLATLAVFRPEALAAVLRALSPSGAGPEALHTAMGRLLPLYYTAMAGFHAVLGVGFWKLWNWTRIVFLAMIGLSLLLMVTEVRSLLAAPTAAAVALTLVRVGLSVLWLWYLRRQPVREAFSRPRGNLAAA